MKKIFTAATIIILFASACNKTTPVRVAQEIFQPVKLSLTDAGDVRFGSSVAVSADSTAIVAGAPGLYGQTNFTGMLVVYRRQGREWTKTDLIPKGGGVTPVYLGASTAISADGYTVIGGAPFSLNADGIGCGAAYIFNFDGTNWNQSRFTAPAAGPGDWFGMSVALSGDGMTAAIGAPSDNYHGWAVGTVYVYRRIEGVWNLFASVHSPDPDTLDFFGISVSLSRDGNVLAIGSYRDDERGEDNGAAYVFRYTGSNWTSRKIMSSVSERKQGFGFSVALSADASILAVGARTADTQFADTGALYIYRLQRDSESETRIIASDRTKELYLGGCVAVSADGSTVFASASGDATHEAVRARSTHSGGRARAGANRNFIPPKLGSIKPSERSSPRLARRIHCRGRAFRRLRRGLLHSLLGRSGPYRVVANQNDHDDRIFRELEPDGDLGLGRTVRSVFGLQTALSLSGGRLVCAAGRDGGLGAVYVYDFDGQSYSWKETKLTRAMGRTDSSSVILRRSATAQRLSPEWSATGAGETSRARRIYTDTGWEAGVRRRSPRPTRPTKPSSAIPWRSRARAGRSSWARSAIREAARIPARSTSTRRNFSAGTRPVSSLQTSRRWTSSAEALRCPETG
jgi:hypothetical protein